MDKFGRYILKKRKKHFKIILQFLAVTMDGFNMSPQKMPFSFLSLDVHSLLGVATKKG
jgi:hypothetical protein